MTVMDPAVQQLVTCLGNTLSPDAATRKQAEEQLKTFARDDMFSRMILTIASTAEPIEVNVRLSAAVTFKNHIKKHWKLEVDSLEQSYEISPNERETIKQNLVNAMLTTEKLIQSQLCEALALVCFHEDYDYENKWPALLPDFVQRMGAAAQQQNYVTINGVLTAANSVFKHIRSQGRSDELYREMLYIIQHLGQPLLDLLKHTGDLVGANAGNADVLRQLMHCATLIARIFYSLNSQEIPEFFEDKIKDWFDSFEKFLCYEDPLLHESDPEKEGVLTSLKAEICSNVYLYVLKNEEEFEPFLKTFVQHVWNLLMKVGPGAGTDRLATNGISVLTQVARGVFHKLFADDATLKNIVESIVLPNLQIGEEDIEQFDCNYVEYIRRDIEGSDSDTRRRMACEFLKVLVGHFNDKVTPLVTGHVTNLLAQYAADPINNWKAKDCAIYLVVALTVKTSTARVGAVETNELVPINAFFTEHIQSEIMAPANARGSPILKADALKFITTFRSKFPKETFLGLLPSIIQLLNYESDGDSPSVVHSYAALVIERTLIISENRVRRFKAADIAPFIGPLLTALFKAFGLGDNEENDYLMKCLMRVIAIMGPDIRPFATECQAEIMKMLVEVSKNPRNPIYNHYLFEAVGALVSNSPLEEAECANAFEGLLFPPFQTILQMDVTEFAPYVFQILSQVLERRPEPLPGAYEQLFTPLLSPILWTRSQNIPSLIRLLQAYLRKAPQTVAKNMEPILGVFQKLVSSKAHDHQGFFILNSLFESLPYQAIEPFMTGIWGLLFSRIQAAKTGKLCRSVSVFTSLFAFKHGVSAVNDSAEKVGPGMFKMLLQHVMLPAMPTLTLGMDKKIVSVGVVKIITEHPAVIADPALTCAILEATVQMFEKEVRDDGDDDEDDDDVTVGDGTAAAAQLSHAGKVERDPVPEVKDGKHFFVTSLGQMSASRPGHFAPIAQQLTPASQQALAGYFQAAGVAFP